MRGVLGLASDQGSQVTAASTSRSRKAFAGLVAPQIDDLDIGLAETGLPAAARSGRTAIDAADGDRDRLALEIGDRANVLVGSDAVGAARVIKHQHA